MRHQRLWKLQWFGRVKQQLRVNCRAGICFPSPASPALIWETKEMIRCPILSIMPHSLTLNHWHLVGLDGWGRSDLNIHILLFNNLMRVTRTDSIFRGELHSCMDLVQRNNGWQSSKYAYYHTNSGLIIVWMKLENTWAISYEKLCYIEKAYFESIEC